MGASAPPQSTALATPHRIFWAAYPSASVDEVHPVEITWLNPRKPKNIESSLAIVPIVAEGIV